MWGRIHIFKNQIRLSQTSLNEAMKGIVIEMWLKSWLRRDWNDDSDCDWAVTEGVNWHEIQHGERRECRIVWKAWSQGMKIFTHRFWRLSHNTWEPRWPRKKNMLDGLLNTDSDDSEKIMRLENCGKDLSQILRRKFRRQIKQCLVNLRSPDTRKGKALRVDRIVCKIE